MKFYLFIILAISSIYANETHCIDTNHAIFVKDTDSAMGRYNMKPKSLTLDILVKAHGHLCDGIAIAFVELSAVLNKIFPNGIVDRTDLYVVSKNSPCLVDAGALMTGARINFKTLSLDNSLAGGFIVQQISTGKTFEVHLKKGIVSKEYKAFENAIRQKRKKGEMVSAKEIDVFEKKSDELIAKVLNAKPESILTIKELKNYHFDFNLKDIGSRSDTINKNMPR